MPDRLEKFFAGLGSTDPRRIEAIHQTVIATDELLNAAAEAQKCIVATKIAEKIKQSEQQIKDQEYVNMLEAANLTRQKGAEALRYNAGKPDWSLVEFAGLEEMVRVLEMGAKKYARGNWKNGNGLSFNECMSSLLRHAHAWLAGEDVDPESGRSHIGHIQCNAMFLSYFIKHPERFTRDDRDNVQAKPKTE